MYSKPDSMCYPLSVRSQREVGHLSEQADNIWGRLIAAQFSIDGGYVHGDALTICPRGIAIQRNVLRGFESRHASLIACACLLIDVLQVTFDLGHPLLIRDGSVSGNNCLHIQRQDALTRSQPVAAWPGPHDGMTADEQDISCEDDLLTRDVDQRVTASMCRPHLDEMDHLVPHRESQFALERFLGQRQRDVVKIEGCEDAAGILFRVSPKKIGRSAERDTAGKD
jgi:hypothetical protein